MTALTRFLAFHALIGFGIAGLFSAMLLWLDVAGLGTLMAQSPVGLVAAGALTFLIGLTFSSVQMGIAVMQLGDNNAPRRGLRLRAGTGVNGTGIAPQAVPVPVRIRAR